MAKKKEKKAGKRMKKKELATTLMDFFHTRQEEVISLKYLFAELHLTTHPLKMQAHIRKKNYELCEKRSPRKGCVLVSQSAISAAISAALI